MTEPNACAAERLDALLADGKITPEEYGTLRAALETAGHAAAPEGAASGERSATRPPLRRSSQHRLLAGVCGGIAEHLGVDPWLIRVLFFLLSPVGAVLVYLVLYFAVPEEGAAGRDDAHWREALRIPWGFAGFLAVFGIIMAVVSSKIMSRFQDMFHQLGGALPWLTRVMLSLNSFILHSPMGLLALILLYVGMVGIYMVLPRRGAARSLYILLIALGLPLLMIAAIYLPLFNIPKLIK